MKMPNICLGVSESLIQRGSNLKAWEQRGLTGLVAIVTQPAIDALNPGVDSETKKYSVTKTFVKAVVGMSVGVMVRMLCEKLATSLVKKGVFNDFSTNLEIEDKGKLIRHSSMLFGVIACVFTNFLLDMPITKNGMNWISKKLKLQNSKENKK